MTYVGTAKNYSSARYTLASVLAGEAGNQGITGMRAVASVIQNRASQNFSNYGASLTAQATARNQFQGQSTPTDASYQVADELLGGTLQDNTGGALYYANPSASTAGWARRLNSSNSLQIGSHFFTDNTKGIPFSGDPAAQMPTSNSSPGTSSTGYTDPGSPGAGPADYGKQLSISSPWDQLKVADLNGDGIVTTDELSTYNAQQAGIAAVKSAKAGQAGNASSIPTAIVTAGNQQAQTQAAALKAIAAGAQAATAATNATNTGIFSGWKEWLGGRLLQVFVFVLAIVFVGVGLYMFAPKMNLPAIPVPA